MEKSETVVVNWTCEEGNYSHASSKGYVPAVARLGRTGGLTSDQAATLRNRCSVEKYAHMNAVRGKNGSAEPLLNGRRQYSQASLDICTWETPRRKGGSMVTRTGAQSREGACSISGATGMLQTNSNLIWEQGLAHEVVVAVRPVITSRKSEGPLGFHGYGQHGGLGDCDKASPWVAGHDIKRPNVVHEPTLKRSGHAYHGEVYRKPYGKAIDESGSLKPDWGKPAVRDFRGGGGNGGVFCTGRITPGICQLRHHSTRLVDFDP